ncbi:hypothetical protein BT69DRAFT_1328861 [Atractiella rhizophila]|nr:hypothetical protein BT69DRAFT_1328861 [Atractiella rhizophila]
MATLKPRRAIREDPAQYRREFSGGNRGYWTILVPTSHLEVPPPHLLTVEYDAWFRESYWESDFGLKNLARRFYISGTKLRDLKGTPFPKIAIDWGTYDPTL